MRCRNAIKKCRILNDNIRGIKSKINSLQSIIEEQNPTFIGISETRLNKGDPLEIEGYEVKRRDRTGDGGGVLIAYKREIHSRHDSRRVRSSCATRLASDTWHHSLKVEVSLRIQDGVKSSECLRLNSLLKLNYFNMLNNNHVQLSTHCGYLFAPAKPAKPAVN